MNNDDERDYAEEEYNRRTCLECDMQHERDEPCIVVELSEAGTSQAYREWIGNSDYPVGYGDSRDGSSTNQTNSFFIGHSGHVTILWQVTNNPFEKYDSSSTYQILARDGSALYVWCDLQFSDSNALSSIQKTSDLLHQIDANVTSIHYIS